MSSRSAKTARDLGNHIGCCPPREGSCPETPDRKATHNPRIFDRFTTLPTTHGDGGFLTAVLPCPA
jgi:hypothetical protein